jgi:hypothetical protein
MRSSRGASRRGEPLRIVCHDLSEIPAAEVLSRLAARQQSVVLGLRDAADSDMKTIIARLVTLLPEDVSIFPALGASGRQGITIMRVVDRKTVLRHAHATREAAVSFGEIANTLVEDLAAKLGLRADDFSREPLIRMKIGKRADPGELPGSWHYSFHGQQCRFENRKTGQVLDVELGYEGELGALDPWFFHQFLSTTPRFTVLADVFVDPFHDTLRALELLADHGFFRRITGNERGRARAFVPEAVVA